LKIGGKAVRRKESVERRIRDGEGQMKEGKSEGQKKENKK
jgi:hypothetical protein